LFDYFKKYRVGVVWGGLFMVLNVLMLLPTPLLTKYLIDTVIPTKNTDMLVLICLVCVFILFLGGLFNILQSFFFGKSTTMLLLIFNSIF